MRGSAIFDNRNVVGILKTHENNENSKLAYVRVDTSIDDEVEHVSVFWVVSSSDPAVFGVSNELRAGISQSEPDVHVFWDGNSAAVFGDDRERGVGVRSHCHIECARVFAKSNLQRSGLDGTDTDRNGDVDFIDTSEACEEVSLKTKISARFIFFKFLPFA